MKIEITDEELCILQNMVKKHLESSSNKTNEESLTALYRDSGIKINYNGDDVEFMKRDGEQPVGCVPCAACVVPPDPPIFAIAFGFLA